MLPKIMGVYCILENIYPYFNFDPFAPIIRLVKLKAVYILCEYTCNYVWMNLRKGEIVCRCRREREKNHTTHVVQYLLVFSKGSKKL